MTEKELEELRSAKEEQERLLKHAEELTRKAKEAAIRTRYNLSQVELVIETVDELGRYLRDRRP